MRRRGFLFGRQPGSRNIPPALQHAHELMGLGKYVEAALAFEQLAASAEGRGGPRAPFLFIQAGRSRLLQNQNPAALAHFRHGLEMFAASQRYTQLYRIGNRVITELKAQGLEKEAREISSFVHSNIPAMAESPTQRGPDPARVVLPTHCPSCGGPLRSDEVDWIDSLNAECAFCGSPVRAS
jgi:hypothetical protein